MESETLTKAINSSQKKEDPQADPEQDNFYDCK